MRSHTHERPFQCTLCDRNFTQSGHFNSHMRQIHNTEPNATNDQLPVKEISCEACCRNFDSISDLDDHMKLMHITANGICKICKRKLTPGCIRVHLRTHTGSKQYKCTLCPTSFQRKDHLETHLGSHTGIKPYQCSVCHEAMFTSASFKRHMRIKHPNVILNDPTDKEKILCSICGKKINPKNIELHMRVHTGKRPYKCQICPLAFAQKSKFFCTILINHFAF